jgi:hypothetical protein
VRPFSQSQPFGWRDILIQGDSVRQVWAPDDPVEDEERKPVRRDPPAVRPVAVRTSDQLNLRMGEELDYVRRLLDALGDQLAGDPILIRRHAVALQSLDIVGQILDHVGNVIRSSDPQSAVGDICMGDLRARLMRSGAL